MNRAISTAGFLIGAVLVVGSITAAIDGQLGLATYLVVLAGLVLWLTAPVVK